jgi:hypothetical protein
MSWAPGDRVTSIFGIGTELLRLRGGGHGAELTSPLVIPLSLKKMNRELEFKQGCCVF